MADMIQGYFFGTSYNEHDNGRPVGLAGYAIPDLGIIFRSRHEGTIHECQYAGLLELLKFIELNKESFKDLEFEILSDSALVIYQISHRKFISRDLAPFYSAAIEYKNDEVQEYDNQRERAKREVRVHFHSRAAGDCPQQGRGRRGQRDQVCRRGET